MLSPVNTFLHQKIKIFYSYNEFFCNFAACKIGNNNFYTVFLGC